MPKFRVVVGGTFRDVWTVEAESAGLAASAYLEDGKEIKEESIVAVTDIWTSEVQNLGTAAVSTTKPKPKKRKRRTKAEMAEAKADKDGLLA